MSTTSTTLKTLWQYSDSQRTKGRRNLWKSLSKLARGEIEGELTAEVIEAVIEQADLRQVGVFTTPSIITDFIIDLAKAINPKSVLDPTCGSGLLLHHIVKAGNVSVAHGIDLDYDSYEIATKLLEGDAKIYCNDLFTIKTDLENEYDLIAADPPLGVRLEKEQLPENLRDFTFHDMSNYVAIWACYRLAPKGTLTILMPSFAALDKKFHDVIHTMGLRFRAILHVPSGSRLNTNVATNIVVIDRNPQKDLFTGQLSKDAENRAHLLRNFKRHKSDGHPRSGRTIALEEFLGYEAVEAQHLLRQRIRGTRLVAYRFSDLLVRSSSYNTLRQVDPDNASENSLYLTIMGTQLHLATDEVPSKDIVKRIYFLDETKVDVHYLKDWLLSDLGQTALRAAGGSRIGFRPRISPLVLENLVCYLPPLDDQYQALEAVRALARIRAEAQELEDQCWMGLSGDDLLERTKTLNHVDRYEDWIESLPYPLASILRRHLASGDDPRVRFAVLLHFFEALAQFLATVHLSAYNTDSLIWQDRQRDLLKLLERQHLRFDLATFGTWKAVVEFLSASTRAMLKDDEQTSIALRLYSVTSTSWLDKLCNSEITDILSKANGVRNKYSGHGGAMGGAQAETIEKDLLTLIQNIRLVFGRNWNQYELIRAEGMTYSRGIYTYKVPRLMGANSQFGRVTRTSMQAMDTDELYLFSKGLATGLKLLPFIRVMASPSNVANACYFYNRVVPGKHRFVSYHFDAEAAVESSFQDTAIALKELTTLHSRPGFEDE